jgi:hypothetical protein
VTFVLLEILLLKGTGGDKSKEGSFSVTIYLFFTLPKTKKLGLLAHLIETSFSWLALPNCCQVYTSL